MNPMSLSELKEREKVLYPNREAEKVMVKDEVKESKNSIVNEKECRGCHKVKNFSEYKKSSNGRYGYASRCNECVKLDEDRATNKLSETIRIELPNIPESKEEFTIEYISNRLKTSKSKTSQALKKLDEDGILTHIYKARTKYYSIAKTEPAKSSYDPITEALPKPVKEVKPELPNSEVTKPKLELTIGSGNTIQGKSADTEVIDDSISDKEYEDLQKTFNKARVNLGIVEATPEQTILDIVDIVYKNAESIEINPQTHELKIKMKG
ncbi:helix-turn-helix domain-containing protein [Methanobacterium spitsbergense]|uniref:Helix-turn-helix domain-containing protein n=1 Tax=Methanobacterium spitsbergense TaxID=2874285 RepID=A0A8T5V037_9EURY|nr:helix-turn-helix domain-containing protein [Methanobacterium spitsbergense]MBZ2166349.1 helix-turn-helix domain-containing protein [Methanobacterium spitsbergense]